VEFLYLFISRISCAQPFVDYFIVLVYIKNTNSTTSVLTGRGGFCYILMYNLIMVKNENVAIYIDGGNLYRSLKNLGIPEKFSRVDYSSFMAHLIGDRKLISKRYYVGVVRNVDNTEKGEQMVKSQQKFLDNLRTEGFDVKPGKIMYDDGKIREKGVDVKLSVDLVIGAVDNLYDTAIVISSDTDLIPAIKYVRNAKNKKIEYIGFGPNPSFGMIKESSAPRIFSSTDMLKFQILK